MPVGKGRNNGKRGGDWASLSERLEALTKYYDPDVSEKRMTERLDRMFAPMEQDAAKFQEELDQRAKSPRPALQPEKNGTDNFERILQDFPWVN